MSRTGDVDQPYFVTAHEIAHQWWGGQLSGAQVEGRALHQKGAVAIYTLRERIGEEAVNRALRRYLEKHRSAGPPYPTSRDLSAELKAVTPDSAQSLLRDLFEEVGVGC